jgi:hypothetical protein
MLTTVTDNWQFLIKVVGIISFLTSLEITGFGG